MSPLLWLVTTGCGLTSFVVPIERRDVDLRAIDDLGTTAMCVAFQPDESLAAVSPEGHAWFLTNGPEGPRFRVVDPYDSAEPLTRTLDMPTVDQMRAWSMDRATFAAGGTVWRLPDGVSRVRLSEPPVPVTDAFPWCGEFESQGAIVSDGRWVQQQDDAWYLWEPGEAAAPTVLIDRDGQCQAADGIVWSLDDDGRLWRVSPNRADFLDGFEAWQDAAATGTDLGILMGSDHLRIGEPDRWVGYDLLGDAAWQALAGGGRSLWLIAPDDAVRLRDGTFERLPLADGIAVLDVEPHDGGVWVVTDEGACHHADGPAIRVTGIRPHQVTLDDRYAFTVAVVEPGAGTRVDWSVTVRANGEPLEATPGADGTFGLAGAYPAAPSTTFAIEATRDEVTLTREVPVHELRLPGERSWALDVAPLFDEHCAECHGVDGISTELTSWEAWVDGAANIEVRVLQNRDMPPGDPTFGDDERTVIEEWLASGRRP